MSEQDRKERLAIHRELEYLRAAGKVKKRQPPAKRRKAVKKVKERAKKLDDIKPITDALSHKNRK